MKSMVEYVKKRQDLEYGTFDIDASNVRDYPEVLKDHVGTSYSGEWFSLLISDCRRIDFETGFRLFRVNRVYQSYMYICNIYWASWIIPGLIDFRSRTSICTLFVRYRESFLNIERQKIIRAGILIFYENICLVHEPHEWIILSSPVEYR